MSSQVYAKVVQLSNRSELVEETKQAIQYAITYFHSIELWARDIKRLNLTSSNYTYDPLTGMLTIDLSSHAFGGLVGDLMVGDKTYTQASTCGINSCTFLLSGDIVTLYYPSIACQAHLPTVCMNIRT